MRLLYLIFAMFLGGISSSYACTGIKLTAKDGSYVNGRTLEFGLQVQTSAAVIPRGYAFVGTTPQGPGLSYKAKYGAVGAIAFDMPALLDGLNEKGLSVGTFYFPGFAGYAEINQENQSKGLSPVDFPNWIITQFATVEEVKNALPNVVIAPTVTKEWGDTPAPFHYIVTDKSGKSIVIEPIQGKLVVSDNPLGIFTNSPTFDWHMTNLRNYVNLSPFNAKPVKWDGLEFYPFGQGSGMVGLPGDFSPPSRFVRAAVFCMSAIPSSNSQEAVYQAFHILNNFDIPVGVARAKEGDIVHTDYTLITCVRDPQTLKYYFKTYDNQTIKVVDMSKLDLNANNIRSVPTTGSNPPAVDITSALR